MTSSIGDFQLYEFGLPPGEVVGRIGEDFGSPAIDEGEELRAAFDARYPGVYVLAAWDANASRLTLVDRVHSCAFRVEVGDLLIFTPTRSAKGPGYFDLSFGTPFARLASRFFYVEPYSSASERWLMRHVRALSELMRLEVYYHPGYSDC